MRQPKAKRRILFLCTGNAARSQMAEALARLYYGEVLDPVSAGSRPSGFVHPMAIQAMEELGADMSSVQSKSADEFLNEAFDVVVTVCDSAAADCPVWPYARRIEHWPIEDPSFSAGNTAARYRKFIERRDELKGRIDELVASLHDQEPAEANTAKSRK
jgi:arsenate reductase